MTTKGTFQVIRQGSHVAVGEFKPLSAHFRPTGGVVVVGRVGTVVKDERAEQTDQEPRLHDKREVTTG